MAYVETGTNTMAREGAMRSRRSESIKYLENERVSSPLAEEIERVLAHSVLENLGPSDMTQWGEVTLTGQDWLFAFPLCFLAYPVHITH